MVDESPGARLDAIGSRLVKRVSTRDVFCNLLFGQVFEVDVCRIDERAVEQADILAFRGMHHPNRHRGVHVMAAPRQSTEHAFCVCGINGLAEDLAPQHDHGVRADDDHRPIILAVDELFDCRFRFSLGKLLHRFERFFKQVVVKRLISVNCMNTKPQTRILEQLPAPRRCACEHYIDCFIHLVVFPQTKKDGSSWSLFLPAHAE